MPLPVEELRARMGYDPLTGLLVAKVAAPSRPIGTVIRGVNGDGYIQLTVKGEFFLGHRLAWLLYYGELPKGRIDHRNEIKSDNRIANLRDGAEKYNPQNVTAANKNSKSGIRGVRYREDKCKWSARIMVDFKDRHLGYFETSEQAEAAYKEAKKVYHPFAEGS